MALTNTTKKLLHLKVWETLNPAPANFVAGSFLTGDKGGRFPHSHALAFLVLGASAVYTYNVSEDAFAALPNSGVAGTGGAGSAGTFHPLGTPGGSSTFNGVSAGATTTVLPTGLTLARSLAGVRIRCVAGTNAGYEGTIASNQMGASSAITVTPPAASAWTASSVLEVYSGSLWYFNGGTTIGFSVYDVATNTWAAKSVTGVTAPFPTSAKLIGTPADDGAFASGTATAGSSTTLTQASANWQTAPINVWANYRVRITGGTGAGQSRVISSHTATVLTVASAWTTNPDSTSTFVIEGNNDALYLMGGGATTLYRYSISGNTWTNVAPSGARAAAPGGGVTASWIAACPTWDASTGQPAALGQGMYAQNGRFIFSFRGGASSALDVYDIAGNVWRSTRVYGGAQETFTVGSGATDRAGLIYITKEVSGRWFVFDVADWELRPWSTQAYNPNSTAVEGGRVHLATYVDGASEVPFVYAAACTATGLVRAFDIGQS